MSEERRFKDYEMPKCEGHPECSHVHWPSPTDAQRLAHAEEYSDHAFAEAEAAERKVEVLFDLAWTISSREREIRELKERLRKYEPGVKGV